MFILVLTLLPIMNIKACQLAGHKNGNCIEVT